MRCQAEALIEGFPPEFRESMLHLTRSFWTNYLAITGELGPTPWTLAYDRVVIAADAAMDVFCPLKHSIDDYIEGYSADVSFKKQHVAKVPASVVKMNEIDVNALCFAGWSRLFHSDDVFEHADL